MPKSETGTDNLGTRYEGPVLSGLLGVKEQLERQAVNSSQTSAQIREIAPAASPASRYPDPANPARPLTPVEHLAHARIGGFAGVVEAS